MARMQTICHRIVATWPGKGLAICRWSLPVPGSGRAPKPGHRGAEMAGRYVAARRDDGRARAGPTHTA